MKGPRQESERLDLLQASVELMQAHQYLDKNKVPREDVNGPLSLKGRVRYMRCPDCHFPFGSVDPGDAR